MIVLENRQLAHILTEVIVLMSVIFWVSRKHSIIMNHIDDLSQRVEEHEDMLKTHDDVINKIVGYINNSQKAYQKPVRTIPKSTPPPPPPSSPVHESETASMFDADLHTEILELQQAEEECNMDEPVPLDTSIQLETQTSVLDTVDE